MTRHRRILVVAILIAASAWNEAGRAQSGPSFDCSKARAMVERLICAEPDLAKADRDMAASYRRALGASRTTRDRDILVRDQTEWLKWRADACVLDDAKGGALPPPDERRWAASCLGIMHGYRTSRLEDVAGLGHVPGPNSGEPAPSLAGADLPGRYTAGGQGWYGVLTVARVGGDLTISIETVSGPTAHTCNLDGKAKVAGRTLVATAFHDAERPKPDERCTLVLTPTAGGFSVEAQEGEPCRYFCGARGNMSGSYYRVPASRR